MLSIILGLLSSFAWGASDYAGGLASRKANSSQVVATAWLAGLILLPVIAILSGEALMSWQNWLWCSAAGVFGLFGILLLFEAMAQGTMGITASVSAVTAAVIPVIVGMFLEGFPGMVTIIGFILALTAVGLISQQKGNRDSISVRLEDLKLPLISGVGFGLYFVLMNQGSQHNTFWPMVASHFLSVIILFLVMKRRKLKTLPSRETYALIALNVILDNAGTMFFILAGRLGRMDVAAVIASLYPGMTILLAWLLLRERISRMQMTGIFLALLAILLLSV